MNSRELHINHLPDEVLQHIFAFLPHLEDRKPLSLVCRRWNDLAFDYSFLGHVKLNFKLLTASSIGSCYKISRYYRNVVMGCHFLKLDEEEIENIPTWFERPSSSLQEFICYSSPNLLAIKFLSLCRNVKTLGIDSNSDIPDDKLPVLESLEELFVEMKRINIIHLAPNLRRLYVKHICRDLPMVIPKLTKLEHLQADFLVGYIDLFQKCTEVTKLTSVDLCLGHIDEKNLKQLCKFCPLLTKLRINVDSSTSLRCLASLIHLKVLSVYALDTTLFANNDVCLPNVEIFQFNIRRNLHFDRSVQRMFPNVHYIKFGYGWKSTIITGKISASFPHLRTLEITHIRGSTDLVDRLVGLSKLRELIALEAVLSNSHLPPMNLPQLTLKHSEFEVTDEMAKNFPNLRFLNLFGKSRCINAEKLPPTCTVRRFHQGCVDDVFDIKL